ncbi:MAG TPA: site-specific integrase [Firmicutes bacterium]|nr:site-specific integrase [Bacillota bacterium]
MPRKRKSERAGWGEGQIQQLAEDKWLVRASGGTDAGGRRIRPSRIVYGSRRTAVSALRQLQEELDTGTYIPPENMTLGDWLREWFQAEYGCAVGDPRETILKTAKGSGTTASRYESIIRLHIIPSIGNVPIQRLRSTHLRHYFDEVGKTQSMTTLELHYMVLHSALDAAVKERLVRENVASSMMGKPTRDRNDSPADVLENCWEAEEAARFLAVAKEAGPQWAAFFTLALDSGMRKGELCGLQWKDIDWEAGTVRIERSLVRASKEPVFGPVKNRRPRTIMIAPETLALLKAHRKHQIEIKLRMGEAYNDFGLVFAKEPDKYRRQDVIGRPLQANNLGEREFLRLIKKAGVRPIKFHGLRHTCATLLLKARVPVHYVAARLGHTDVGTTLRIYAHAIPSGEREMLEDLRRALGLFQK